MQIKKTLILDLLRRPLQFVLYGNDAPYESCSGLHEGIWDSLFNGRGEPVLYSKEKWTSSKHIHRLNLVLGHQFLIRALLLITALARAIEETGDLWDVTSKQLRGYYLLNEPEKGLLRYKLLPHGVDHESLFWLLEKGTLGSKVTSEAIRVDFERFLEKFREKDEGELTSIYHQLKHMTIWEFALDDFHDEGDAVEDLISIGTQLDLLLNAPSACEEEQPRQSERTAI